MITNQGIDKYKGWLLRIKFNDRNQVNDKIAWELDEGVLSLLNTLPFFPGDI